MAMAHNTASSPTRVWRKELFSIRDAAAYLGVSTSTVHRRIAAGTLRAAHAYLDISRRSGAPLAGAGRDR